jgi:hypothetical protein
LANTNWKDIAELLGIAAIVASLIFVGLQMKQSQQIAASAVAQARTSDSLAIRLAPIDSPALRSAQAKVWGMTEGELTADEQVAYAWHFWSELVYLDNLHYQYVSGFLTEQHWLSSRPDLIRLFSDPFYRNLWKEAGGNYRQSFMDVIDQVIKDVEVE